MRILLAILLVSAVGITMADDTNEETSKDKAVIEETRDAVAPAPQTTEEAQTKVDTITTESGLKYFDYVVGEGDAPVKGKPVTVNYTGWLTNGKKFDSSVDRNQPFTFTLGVGEVIKGWDEGVASMKVGGKRRLIIPPELGYGSKSVGSGLIPANSTLIFDVELLSVQK